MRKIYIKPEVDFLVVEQGTILAGSGEEDYQVDGDDVMSKGNDFFFENSEDNSKLSGNPWED